MRIPALRTADAAACVEVSPLSRIVAMLLFALCCSSVAAGESLASQTSVTQSFETLTFDQLQKGQKGYGLSVFDGTEPERFEVEVVGVWRNTKPELDFLLARLSGQDLERSGVLAGMSGSPVFFDGKLVGAVAFSFGFGLDPIAGITPIDAMRQLSSAGGGLGTSGGAGTAGASAAAAAIPVDAAWAPSLQELVARDFPADALDKQLAQVGASLPRSADGRRAVVWTTGGLGEPATALLRSRLGTLTPMAPASTLMTGAGDTTESTDATDADLQPGDAVALMLVHGDLHMAAHGTVTDRYGDSIVAFGHPVYALGPVRFPMATSEVITTLASRNNSFKLSNAGKVIGTFDQDREAGAHGVLGQMPTMVPVEVRLSGVEDRVYHFELTDAPVFLPTLFAVTTLGAVTTGSYAGGFFGLDLEATLRLQGHPDLVLRQSFDGNNAATDLAIYLLGFLAFLQFNDLEHVAIESAELNIHQVKEPRTVTLVGAYADRQKVAPGEQVAVHLELQHYRGERVRQSWQVEIPADLADGKYYLMIGDGTSMDVARQAVTKRVAETVSQNLATLGALHSRRELHFLGLVAAPGLAVAGDVLPDLPGSMRSVFARAEVGDPLTLRISDQRIEPLEVPLEGILRIDFDVSRSSN